MHAICYTEKLFSVYFYTWNIKVTLAKLKPSYLDFIKESKRYMNHQPLSLSIKPSSPTKKKNALAPVSTVESEKRFDRQNKMYALYHHYTTSRATKYIKLVVPLVRE